MSLQRWVWGGAVPLALVMLVAAASPALAQREIDVEEGRPQEAVEACTEYAQELLEERNRGNEVDVDRIIRAEEDDDIVKVQGYLEVNDRDGDRRRSAWLDCDVDFDGDNEVTYFDEESFFRRLDRQRDRDRGSGNRRNRGGGDGDLQQEAREACREMVQDQRFEIGDIRDVERTDSGASVRMRIRNNNRRFDATCVYNRDSEDARFARLERVNN